ncbi:MAG TPA: PucR family transcriptional regulator ligand-binding domain-containing protein [Mycobacterium sp.]|nr:PucR family transcriptional regulator ligand-binding domain-containing protein [Mycobacterium sp.]
MSVPVSWVLAQSDLALLLKGGSSGVTRGIDLALTTELASPFQWLSGGELVLTTGIRLPPKSAQRADYLRGLDDCGVAGVGFGTGLTHADVPADLIAAADEIGIPLFEVPLKTPFAAVVKCVTARHAEIEYNAVLRASQAQPRMTRAVIQGGARAIIQELARSLTSTVLVLDSVGQTVDSHPRPLDTTVLSEVRAALSSGALAGTTSIASGTAPACISHQRIRVGRKSYGELIVISTAPLSHVDQILLGHANSLLALDFDKPARLQKAQQQLNGHALGLLLANERDLGPAWAQLAPAADSRCQIRVLVIDADTASALDVAGNAVTEAVARAGHPHFIHTADTQLIAVLPGDEGTDLARGLVTELNSSTRRLIRVGISSAQPLDSLVAAVKNARLAASAAERNGLPLEFGTLAGRALLSVEASRKVLDAVADTMLSAVVDHDDVHHTDLLASLQAFLEANGHWETAAATIGVHRHTLRKRLATVQALLGCNLDVARVRAELLLALISRRSV